MNLSALTVSLAIRHEIDSAGGLFIIGSWVSDLEGSREESKEIVARGIISQPYEEWVDLRNRKKVFLRPVKETDGRLLVELLKSS